MKRIMAVLMAMLMLVGACAAAEAATMTVQGTGIVQVDADRATISLGVRDVAVDVMTAQAAVNERIAAVIDALKEAGAPTDAIVTNGIGIYPNYDYSDGETIIGYTAYNGIYVTLADVDNVGAYIDAAFAAGANSLDYVEFSAAQTDEAADKALTLAVQSARAKAETLAAAAGVRLGEIVELRDSENAGYDMNDAFAATEDAGKGAATQVLPSRQQVTATVYITFEITGE